MKDMSSLKNRLMGVRQWLLEIILDYTNGDCVDKTRRRKHHHHHRPDHEKPSHPSHPEHPQHPEHPTHPDHPQHPNKP